MVVTAAVLTGLMAAGVPADEELPQELRGFSGLVRGEVASKGEKHTFTFKVYRVLRVWKNSKAEEPKSIIGRTIRINPRWEKADDGRWRPIGHHVAFVRYLEVGAEISIEVQNAERSHFNILELDEDQVATIRSVALESQLEDLKAEVLRLRVEVAELRLLLRELRDQR
jgi:hypothetical protein